MYSPRFGGFLNTKTRAKFEIRKTPFLGFLGNHLLFFENFFTNTLHFISLIPSFINTPFNPYTNTRGLEKSKHAKIKFFFSGIPKNEPPKIINKKTTPQENKPPPIF